MDFPAIDLSAFKPRVFLVDDDDDDRFLFKDALREMRQELDLVEFADGESFMDRLSGEMFPPDVIFLDLNLPKRSGIECLDHLRKHFGDFKTKVCIISTSSSKSTIEATRHKGANHYIRKPESFSSLKSLIGIALANVLYPATTPYYLNDLVE